VPAHHVEVQPTAAPRMTRATGRSWRSGGSSSDRTVEPLPQRAGAASLAAVDVGRARQKLPKIYRASLAPRLLRWRPMRRLYWFVMRQVGALSGGAALSLRVCDAPGEEELDHARLELRFLDVGEPAQQVQHPDIVGQHICHKSPDPARGRRSEQLLQQHDPDALALPGIQHDEGDLRGVLAVRRLVPRHGDQLGRLSGSTLDDQGQPAAIVDVGENTRPIGWQSLHHREEPLIRAVSAETPIALDQSGGVTAADRTHAQVSSVAQLDVALELCGVWRGWSGARLSHRRRY